MIIIFTLLSYFAALGQNTEIYRKIPDKETSESIPFASVSLYENGFGTLVDGTISDENGNFKIEYTGQGEIQAIISFIGFIPDTITGIVLCRFYKSQTN
ncbi:MAG: carboxypeptidase-like regulatory domain-containing protein [Prolixibacteraceae bacterium]|nr:carboxypeptidase-like regulatory domain-containing protein [Prolixibacteraceae bacterium]